MRTIIEDSASFAEEMASWISGKWQTNCFLSVADMATGISEGKWSRLDFDGGVYLFFTQETWFDFYFFLKNQAIPLPELDKPIILERVHLEKKAQAKMEPDWTGVGFVPFLERKRLYLGAKQVPEVERLPQFATADEAELILSAMRENFDVYSSALPTLAQLQADIANKLVLAYREEGKLLGFLRFGTEKNISTLWQIVVLAEGRGIGSALVLDWLTLEREAVKRFVLWVKVDNTRALQMYEKFGFLPDGRIATVMQKGLCE